jgi:hypothetical protein
MILLASNYTLSIGRYMSVGHANYLGKGLATGTDGFICSSLVGKLMLDGHSLKAFVQYYFFNSLGWFGCCTSELRGNFEVIVGDIRDPYGLKKDKTGCCSVAHLAGVIVIVYLYNSRTHR